MTGSGSEKGQEVVGAKAQNQSECFRRPQRGNRAAEGRAQLDLVCAGRGLGGPAGGRTSRRCGRTSGAADERQCLSHRPGRPRRLRPGRESHQGVSP